MSEKMMKKSKGLIAALLGTMMIAALTLWGCGTSSYDDPSATTTKSPAIIDAATLKGWIDEGKLNAPYGSKDRVVVVSTSTVADWTVKGHIPGAVRLGTDELAKNRVEGLALASSMMPDGPMMDGLVKRLGIDSNTTIVISLPKNSTLYYQSIAFWDFRYWGFARDRIKILNGGDDAWDFAGLPLVTDATEKYAESTYSVSKNAALKDVVRYSIGETIATIDSKIAAIAASQPDNWQIIDVRGPTISPYVTNALRYTVQGTNPAYAMYFTRLNNDPARNFVFPDKQTLETIMGSLAVKDGTLDAFVSPTKKTVVMCQGSSSAAPSFVLFDAVLNVPEGDIVMYDGSYNQWAYYSNARLTAQYPSAATNQISAWAFDNVTNQRSQGTMLGTTVTGWDALTPYVGPSHPDMNQIEIADKAYIVPAATTVNTGGSSSGGGSAPGGC